MGARGSEIRAGFPGGASETAEMAVLSPCDQSDTPGEVHGKEGVNGSSPLEGFVFPAWLSRMARAGDGFMNLVGARGGTASGSSRGTHTKPPPTRRCCPNCFALRKHGGDAIGVASA